ncbi:MAG: nuclear transport factor 2 family protein [Chthoniobacterales bacterium]
MTLPISIRTAAISLLLIAVGTTGFLFWSWQPKRQVEKALQRTLAAVENKDGVDLAAQIANDYSDEWGFNRPQAVEYASQGLKQFFWITIVPQNTNIEIDGDTATITCNLLFEGHGTSLAQIALDRAQALKEPFVFSFRRESWKPWDWKISSASQPEVQINPNYLP